MKIFHLKELGDIESANNWFEDLNQANTNIHTYKYILAHIHTSYAAFSSVTKKMAPRMSIDIVLKSAKIFIVSRKMNLEKIIANHGDPSSVG
jgi:hypothetical protein